MIKKPCSADGCERLAEVRDLCRMHYQQMRKFEREAGIGRPARTNRPTVRRIGPPLAEDHAANESPDTYRTSPALQELVKALESKRDELIAIGATDAEKLETLRGITHQWRRQYLSASTDGIWARPEADYVY